MLLIGMPVMVGIVVLKALQVEFLELLRDGSPQQAHTRHHHSVATMALTSPLTS